MKKLLIILSVALFSFRSAQYDDTAKLYIMALKSHLSVLKKESNSGNKEIKTNATIFLINEDVSDLPDKIDGHPIQVLGENPLKYLGNESSLYAVKINPIRVNAGTIIIQLSDYIITKGKEEANISFSGGKEYFFSYNDKTKKYSIVQTKTISY